MLHRETGELSAKLTEGVSSAMTNDLVIARTPSALLKDGGAWRAPSDPFGATSPAKAVED
jgi:hypothetical protein